MLVQFFDEGAHLRDVVVVLRSRVAGHAALRGWVYDAAERQLESMQVDLFQQEVLDLQVEIERVTMAQSQLNEAVQAKLGEYGVPMQELGFIPRGK